MERVKLKQKSKFEWVIEPTGKMRVPGVIYASRDLLDDMDDKVFEQTTNVATLPGIVQASYAMPDAHWGYGFPIGGVAAFDADEGGVISAGGVGFDISCGVRTLTTGLRAEDIRRVQDRLAQTLFETVPAGVGSTGKISLSPNEMDAMLTGGARWAVAQGWGIGCDLDHIEERGRMEGALPDCVSDKAIKRQKKEMGTLGSGNHYLEIQEVEKIFDQRAADAFAIKEGDAVLSIHCGSRGLGHQIGTEYLREMAVRAKEFGIDLPDRELACAPIRSDLGQRYLGAMRAGINCAMANRQIITHLARQAFAEVLLDRGGIEGHAFMAHRGDVGVDIPRDGPGTLGEGCPPARGMEFAEVLPEADLKLLYDISHNTCKEEEHIIDGKIRNLFVHRKGATRAFGPGHPAIPEDYRHVGQPVLIGGSMGTHSYILAGTGAGEGHGFSSACHGAGRRMSRHAATRKWRGRAVVDDLAAKGITVKSSSDRGIAEEAPGAYKDVTAVIDIADSVGLAHKVARLKPLACIKG